MALLPVPEYDLEIEYDAGAFDAGWLRDCIERGGPKLIDATAPSADPAMGHPWTNPDAWKALGGSAPSIMAKFVNAGLL
jgi:hypothetical protein